MRRTILVLVSSAVFVAVVYGIGSNQSNGTAETDRPETSQAPRDFALDSEPKEPTEIDLTRDVKQNLIDTEPKPQRSIINDQAPLELVQDVDQSDPIEGQAAWDSGYKKISELDAQRVLRWRPVIVNPNDLIRPGETNNDPVESISLSVFPGETVVVYLTNFRQSSETASMSWTGVPDNVELGKLSIHIVPKSAPSDLRAFIHYSTRYKDFHVVPTDDS